MQELVSMIHNKDMNPLEIAKYLDSCDANLRLTQMRRLTGSDQAQLYERFADVLSVDLNHFVPPDVPLMTEVIHHGKNSLPMFTHFQKRFCRPTPHGAQVWGYNEQTMRWVTGPGYFVTHLVEHEARLVIDYTQLPENHPTGWPAIQPNSRLLSRFVYYQMRDYMWRVSNHLSVGRAYRNGKALSNYFVLCREDPT